MKNKQNHNIVKVEIPAIGEYILTILDYMLIVKCIADQTYQYSEFMNIANKYIMTSVNCRTGNVMRIMEEFCKSHNCPKRMLREEIEKAEKVKKSESTESEAYDELKAKSIEITKENALLISKLNETDDELFKYKEELAIITAKYNNLYSKMDKLKFMCQSLMEGFDISDEIDEGSIVKWNEKENDTGIYINKETTSDSCMDDGDVINLIYEKIKSFMDSNSEQKNDSKCVINKFYDEFIKTLDKNELNVSYDIFVDFLKDIYRNHENINIDDKNKLITNIIYRSAKRSTKSSSERKGPKNILDKSTVVNSRPSGRRNSKNKTYTRNMAITSTDSKVILDMWKTMTARQIAEMFPMYSVAQIGQYCTTHSDFVKIGTPKKLIDELKSYNGTKTLQEMAKLCGRMPSNVKKLCKTYNIQYKEV